MHPHPVKQPTLTQKFPLTDMPTGLMAALATRLADHLLISRAFQPIRSGRHRQRPVDEIPDTSTPRQEISVAGVRSSDP